MGEENHPKPFRIKGLRVVHLNSDIYSIYNVVVVFLCPCKNKQPSFLLNTNTFSSHQLEEP